MEQHKQSITKGIRIVTVFRVDWRLSDFGYN
jgi:hypothetical protein